MPEEPEEMSVEEQIAELQRFADDRLATVVATLDQLQAEIDRRDDTLLDLAAVLAICAVSILVAELLLRRAAA